MNVCYQEDCVLSSTITHLNAPQHAEDQLKTEAADIFFLEYPLTTNKKKYSKCACNKDNRDNTINHIMNVNDNNNNNSYHSNKPEQAQAQTKLIPPDPVRTVARGLACVLCLCVCVRERDCSTLASLRILCVCVGERERLQHVV